MGGKAMTELKPCPFCGGEGKLILGTYMMGVPCKIECQNESCGAEMSRFSRSDIPKLKKLVINKWNRRVGDEN